MPDDLTPIQLVYLLLVAIGPLIIVYTIYATMADHLYRKGRDEMLNRNYQKGVVTFTRLIALRYCLEETYVIRGLAYGKLEEFDKAVADFNKALQHNRTTSWKAKAHNGLGMAYYEQKNWDYAITHCDKSIETDPHLSESYDLRAFLRLVHLKDTSGAIADYYKVIERNPRHAEAYNHRGWAHYLQGNVELALEDLDKALRIDSRLVNAYRNRATIYAKQSELEKALLDLNKAIEFEPNLDILYVSRAAIYFQQKNYGSYISDCSKIIHLGSQYTALYYNNRGYGHSLQGDLENALADCNEAIRLDPQLMYGYGSRGHTYFLMGKYGEALEDFNKQAELKPDHKFAIAGQAVTHHALGQVDEAKVLWQSLIALDDKYRNAEALRDEYQAADPLIEEARKLIASLEN